MGHTFPEVIRLVTIFARTVIIYILLLAVIRLMGKRQIGELEVSELVTTLLLSELASQPISDSNIPLLNAVVPILVLLTAEVILSYVLTKSKAAKKLLNGTPSILINKGVLDQKELNKSRISVEELMGELRLKDISDISAVNYAILEQSGKISVIPKSGEKNASVADLKLQVPEKGIAHALVVDGEISDFNLGQIGQSREYIDKLMKKNSISDIRDIFLLTVDDMETVNIIRKVKK